MKIKVKKIFPDAKLPHKTRRSDVGWDLFSNQTLILPAKATTSVSTGISVALPENTFALILTRSSLASKGIFVEGGVIDNEYRGELKVILHNSTYQDMGITHGNKIAQLVLFDQKSEEIEEVNELDETDRGDRGFGSTGA